MGAGVADRQPDGRASLPLPLHRRLPTGLRGLQVQGCGVRARTEGGGLRHRGRLQGSLRQPLGSASAKEGARMKCGVILILLYLVLATSASAVGSWLVFVQ